MIRALLARFQQRRRTIAYPAGEPVLPDWFRGVPAIDPVKCIENCDACRAVCPTGALRIEKGRVQIDLGRCLFCGECAMACPNRAISFTGDYRLAVRKREDLRCGGEPLWLATALDAETRRVFGRALRLRQVSAGGCNACEA